MLIDCWTIFCTLNVAKMEVGENEGIRKIDGFRKKRMERKGMQEED